MQAGLLKERISIWKSTIILNDFGEETTEWEESCRTRARLIHNSNTRTIENDEIIYPAVKTFEVRYYVDVNEFDRIQWNNRMYSIIDITPDQDIRKQTIRCQLINE